MKMDHGSGYSVLIRNLRYYTSPDYVRERFEAFGKVRDVYLPVDYATRRPRGFGFVEYYEKQDALDAIKSMDNTEFDGGVIACFFAQDRRKSPESMRRAYNSNSARFNGSGPKHLPPRHGYYEPRYRSRSRSPPRGRRSPSYSRRYTPYDRPRNFSPPRYHREYRPTSRFNRDHPPPPRYPRDPRDLRPAPRFREYSRPTSPRHAASNRNDPEYSRQETEPRIYSNAPQDQQDAYYDAEDRGDSVDRYSSERHQPPSSIASQEILQPPEQDQHLDVPESVETSATATTATTTRRSTRARKRT